MSAIAPYIEAFLREHLAHQRGASHHTCDSYAYSFQSLFEFAAHKLKVAPSALMLEQLDATLICAFLEYLEGTRRNSAQTRNIRLAAIRSFFRFLQHREPAALDQIRRILAIPFKNTDTRLVAAHTKITLPCLLCLSVLGSYTSLQMLGKATTDWVLICRYDSSDRWEPRISRHIWRLIMPLPPSRGLVMISTLINLLGRSYESNDFAKAESIAQSIHKAVPGDEISLKFLGLVYFRTGRIKDAMQLFDRVHRRQDARPEKIGTGTSAVVAVSQEATKRVPYLAQAWHELGCALLKLRGAESAPQSFQGACLA